MNYFIWYFIGYVIASLVSILLVSIKTKKNYFEVMDRFLGYKKIEIFLKDVALWPISLIKIVYYYFKL